MRSNTLLCLIGTVTLTLACGDSEKSKDSGASDGKGGPDASQPVGDARIDSVSRDLALATDARTGDAAGSIPDVPRDEVPPRDSSPSEGRATDGPGQDSPVDGTVVMEVGKADSAVEDASIWDAADLDAPVDQTNSAPEAGMPDTETQDGGTTVVDPAPNLNTPGKFLIPTTCANCPSSTETQFTLNAGTATSHPFQGVVTGAQGNGTFYVAPDTQGQTEQISGPVPTDSNGNYNVTVPLFCGAQIVKMVWTNAQGQLAIIRQVTTTGCSNSDIRVTITWDAVGRDYELHLIKPNGRINDQATDTDCTWTTCVQSQPDWGVLGDTSDNPRKDVDNTSSFGPENIYLSKPENGLYTVMVEHWSGSGSATSGGQAIINVKGKAHVFTIANFAPYWVWTVATIEWPTGKVTLVDTRYNCSSQWASGCIADIP